jgi:hypothetical protein
VLFAYQRAVGNDPCVVPRPGPFFHTIAAWYSFRDFSADSLNLFRIKAWIPFTLAIVSVRIKETSNSLTFDSGVLMISFSSLLCHIAFSPALL